jgi:hypothetical protein
VLVRVVDASGREVPNVAVRLGSLREGDPGGAHVLPTRADGVAQFEHLATGPSVSYRASVESDGARFSSDPFQLDATAGHRVQLVRYAVSHDTATVLATEARVEITFAEDRLVVVERIRVANLSTMSLRADPTPLAYAPPPDGLRFALPDGYTAFRADEQTMGDQHMEEESGAATFRGSIPPASDPTDPQTLVFQYRLKLDGERMAFDVSFPIHVFRAMVITQAPRGMALSVDGMVPAEADVFQGQRILVTQRALRSHDDASLDHLHIVLSGLPAVAGPERTVALLAAFAIVAGSAGLAFRRTRRSTARRRRAAARRGLERERTRVLADAAELARAREAGEVGPETHERRRRELALALARVLRELAETRARAATAA